MRLLLLTALLVIAVCPCCAQVNIYEGDGSRRNVTLTPFVAGGPDSAAIIVCPGGSYFWHDMQTEGSDVARWLRANGLSAFVLRYRVAGFPAFFFRYRLLFRGHGYPEPQDDLRQAIAYLRQHSAEYAISPRKIGALGFSAGGHLAVSAAEAPESSERPAFVGAVYPVVTMSAKCVHKRSRRALLGERRKHDKKLRDALSLEQNVPPDCPPVFLCNCKDDPIVDCHNSELLDSALTARGVPHVYMQYETGGHGFGASDTKGSEECRQWRQAFLDWYRHLPL